MSGPDLLGAIRACFHGESALYSRHARQEMASEEFGAIHEHEVFEAIGDGEVIEEYLDDRPYPSVLVFGRTLSGRPLHVVCAYDGADDVAIVVTAYQPDPDLWVDFRRRRQR